MTDRSVQAVIFDLGGVLIDSDPRYLYLRIFDSEEEMEAFLSTVCTPEWNAELDRGRSFEVEVSEDGDREFTFYRSVPAADELLSPEDIKRETLWGASFVSFGSIPLINDPVRSATHRCAELAKEMEIPVAFDVNLREHLWESVETARETIEPMLDISTVVKLSDDELSPVLGRVDAGEAAGILLDRGVSLVLISMGGEGAFYATREFDGSLPTFEIDKVVDATGAGDAFLAATLTHLSESPGWLSDEAAVREAVRRGTAAGALACTDYGAMRALPTREELERFMSVRS